MTARKSELFLDVTTDLLSRGHQVRFRAEGDSMHPTIRGGEAIVVEPASVADLKKGAVALYRAARGITAHRVVGIEETRFLMRGDATASGTEPVEAQQILGKVVAVERQGRSIDLTNRRAKMEFLMSTYVSGLKRRVRGACPEGNGRCARLFSVLLVVAMVFSGMARAAQQVTLLTSATYNSGTTAVANGTAVTFTLDLTGLVTTGSGLNNYLLVGVTDEGNTADQPDTAGTVSSLTWNGTALTRQCSIAHSGTSGSNPTYTNSVNTEIWYLKTPASGSHSVSITITGATASSYIQAVAAVFADVGSLGTCGTETTPAGSATTDTVTIANPGTGGAAFAVLGVKTLGTNVSIASQTGTSPTGWDTNTAGEGGFNCATGGCAVGGGVSYAGAVTSMSASYSSSSNSAFAAVGLTAQNTTAVTLSSLTATPSGSGNLIQLRTGRDVNNLGFNLYREQNGQRVKLNSSLLAGSAFQAGAGTTLTAGSTHTWLDDRAGRGASYWVEEIDLRGKRTWYGPATPQAGGTATPGVHTNAVALSRLGNSAMLTSHPVQRRAGMPGTSSPKPQPLIRAAGGARLPNGQTQWGLAAGKGVQIGIQAEGWYRIGFSDLNNAGLDPGANPDNLQLFVDGVEQPMLVQGNAIEFYGTGLDTTWSDTRVYWVVAGSQAGKRIQSASVKPGTSAVSGSFPYTIERADRSVYFAALLNGDANNFFGPTITGEPVDQTLNVTHLSGGSSQLRISLQGAAAGSHGVSVQVNGNAIGTVSFADETVGVSTFEIANGQIHEGTNHVLLTSLGGDSDVSLVDSIELTYAHSYTADNDKLRLSAAGGQTVRIDGFSSSNIQVVDITDASAVMTVPGTVTQAGGTYSVVVTAAGSRERTLLAFTDGQIGQPVSITANHPSTWHQQQAGADVVMIGHADFLQSLGPLKTLRQTQGHTVAVIDVQDLYDEFSFGSKTPYAIQDFLLAAQSQWTEKPRFVLLAGDATFDPRNYLGMGNFDFVPTKLVDTSLLETASDGWFADFNGTGIPQMAIGRLPVRTATEAAAMVSKIIGYDQNAGGGAKNQALVVADANDSGNDFEGYSNAVKALLPAQMGVTQIYSGEMTGAQAHTQLLQSLNSGQSLVNYVGHGSEDVWADGLLSSTDAAALTNGGRLPFFVSMTCLNGYFQDVYTESLAKTLVKASNGGAVAAYASSGLTNSSGQAVMNLALIQALYGGQPVTIGEAVGVAKQAVGDPDIRSTWILFGDPATKLQ